jgi:hypothetical protein
MPTPESLAKQFEAHRGHLRAVAYRMLGSPTEGEDIMSFDIVPPLQHVGAEGKKEKLGRCLCDVPASA